jgi:hypothetical protein
MLFRRPKPKTSFRQDVIAAIGRALLMAVWLAVLSVPLLLLGWCQIAVPDQIKKRAEDEAARLAACERLTMLPVRLGQHSLTIPANGAATVVIGAPNRSGSLRYTQDEDVIRNETSKPGLYNAAHFFCVLPFHGNPPFEVQDVYFYGIGLISKTPAGQNLQVMHGLPDQDRISYLAFRPYYGNWANMGGSARLPEPTAETRDQMVTARSGTAERLKLIGRTNQADEHGLFYAAHCTRLMGVNTRSSCDLSVFDSVTNLLYRVENISVSSDTLNWRNPQPVPDSFVQAGLMMRRMLGDLANGRLQP